MYVHHSAQQKLLYVHVYSNKLKQDLNSSCKHYFNDYHYSISFLQKNIATYKDVLLAMCTCIKVEN